MADDPLLDDPFRDDPFRDDSDDAFAIVEAAQVAARETVPVPASSDRVAGDRVPGDRVPLDRPTEAVPVERETVLVDDKVLGGRETVKVPSQRRPPERRRGAPLPVAAAFAMLWAAFLSYVPVAAVIGLARTLEGQGGLGPAARAGMAAWLLGHGVPIGTSIGSLGLAPLLLSLLIAWRLNRAGLHVTRAIGARRSGSVGDALLVAFAIALGYSLLGSICGLVVDSRHSEVSAGHAAINFFVFGLAGSLIGSLRGTDALSTIAGHLPRVVRHGVRTGLVAAFLLLAVGAALAGLAIAVSGGKAADIISAYHTGVAGQAGITLVSLGYGVNAAIWATAYLLGPGFALGTGSAVRLTEVTLGSQPALPLLAGLPREPMGAAGAALLALPAVAGLAAGWLLTMRVSRDAAHASWGLLIGSALIAGPAAGVVLGVLASFSGGSLGDGRMAVIGPDPWPVGLLAALVVGVSAVIGAAACRTFGPARFRPAPFAPAPFAPAPFAPAPFAPAPAAPAPVAPTPKG